MSSIYFTAHGRCARATVCEPITTGSVGLSVSFAFDAAWSGLQKTAIFRGSGMAVDLVLSGDAATVPPEVLTIPGGDLRVGVWGADPDGNVIIPTVWANVGEIVPGAAPSGFDPDPPTPSWAAQVQEIAQDALDTANSVREDADAGAFDGATYTPAVSAVGDLSWTNDKGKPNPPTVNIKGPEGQPGQTGATPDISIGTVETLPPGSPATATITGTAENPVLSFGIPQGQQGAPGEVTQAEFDDLADEVSQQKSAFEDIEAEVYYSTTVGLADLTWDASTGLKYETGTTISRAGYTTSEYITVYEGEQIPYTLTGQNNLFAVICAYDSDGVYKRLSSVGYDSGTPGSVEHTFSGTYTVPAGIAKIRLGRWLTTGSANDAIAIPAKSGLPKQNALDIAQLQTEVDQIQADIGTLNQWKAKTLCAFGTSITDTGNSAAVDPNNDPLGKYLPYLIALGEFGELNPLPTVSGIELDHTKSTNYGLAGASINGHILSWIDYYLHTVASHKRGDYADLIIIEGGVNDFAGSIPLGNVGDTVPHSSPYFDYGTSEGTFAGACYQAFTRALTYAPGAVVVYITDSTGKAYGNNNFYQLYQNSLGLYQRDYAEMALAVAKFVGIPAIDAGADSMINAQNPDYLVDWIHHTYLGGYQYAQTIWAKLKGIPAKALAVPN